MEPAPRSRSYSSPGSEPPASDPRGYDPKPGWKPADDDVSLEAIDYRARTALRRANRGLDAINKLVASIEHLDATIKASDTQAASRWRIAVKLLWAVGVPVLVAGVLAGGAYVWGWLSTLHH